MQARWHPETGPGSQPRATVSIVPSSRRLATRAAICVLLVVASCASPPERTSVPAPADTDLESALATGSGTTSSLAPTSTTEATRPSIAAVGGGLIAASGPTGLRFLQSDGSQVAELAGDQVVVQPTWSRDGRQLAATIVDPSSGTSVVAVVDTSIWDVATSVASRDYFFYSWNHDGTRLAALGPGESGGTSLDILDDSGALSSNFSLESSSIYVAWEPGGDRLLVHAGPNLWLMTDPDSPQEHKDFGSVGFGFQAPAWVPGTEDFLYVEGLAQPPEAGSDASANGVVPEETITLSNPRLVRRSAGTGELTDLGDAEGLVMMSVHPGGGLAALSLVATPAGSANPDDGSEAASGASASDAAAESELSSGAVWIINLDTGERAAVLDSTGFWLEWSHDGLSLLIAAPTTRDPDGATLAWHVWDGQEAVELARFTPTVAFVRDYMRFADQYVETPRLWSPDSDAIVFGATSVGLDTTAVARLDGMGGVRNLGVADVSFWSPPPLDATSTGSG